VQGFDVLDDEPPLELELLLEPDDPPPHAVSTMHMNSATIENVNLMHLPGDS
jgi:hypothetical protein